MKISGVIVAYNEEARIEKALKSLRAISDEIILFDSYSTDGTVKIARKYGCRVFQHEFDNHRNQKNRAIEKCRHKWIFVLDADESLEPSLIKIIPKLTDNKEQIDGFSFNTKDYIDGVLHPELSLPQLRLFTSNVRYGGHPFHHQPEGYKKSMQIYDQYIIHERTMERCHQRHAMYSTLLPEDFVNGGYIATIGTEHEKKWETVNVYRDYINKK